MSFDDEMVLTSLGAALETVPVAPTDDELDAFLALVAGRVGPDVATPHLRDDRARRNPVRSVLVAAAATVSLVLVGGVGLLATGDPLPNSLRAPVRALGIRVDDAALARARTAMGELRAALDAPDDARVRAAAVALVARLRALAPGDRAEIEDEARALIGRADERLNGAASVQTDAVAPPTTGGEPAATDAAESDGGAGPRSRGVGVRGPRDAPASESEAPESADDGAQTEAPETGESHDGAETPDTGD